VDEVAKAAKERSQKIKSALLGYAKIDIATLKLVFRRYNSRGINEEEVRKMVESLKKGMERYFSRYLIDFALKLESLVLETLSQEEGDGGDDFNFLEWTEGKVPTEVQACSGQHRVAALLALKAEYEAALKKLETEREAERKKFKKADGPDNSELIRELGRSILALQRKLRGLTVWGVRVYDIGEC